ncbi:MAG: hypothetical protein CL609_13325 [Anaerolineaceae bacterium]|nr:hypothetical protein [Anaerolineaceae bacterium]
MNSAFELERVEDLQKYLNLIVDKVHSGILVVNRDLQILWLNQWLLNRVAINHKDILGQYLPEIFPEIKSRNLDQAFELVFMSGLPLTLSNRIHKYFLKLPPDDPNLGIIDMPQSVMISPLHEGDDLIAAMVMINDVTERVITEQNLQFELSKLSVLHEIDQALATLDLDSCLQEITNHAITLFEADRVCLFLFEDEELKPYGRCLVEGKRENNPQMETMKNVLSLRKPILVFNTANEKNYETNLPDYRSEMAVPMVMEDVPIGVLDVQSNQVGKFRQNDLFLLETVAARAAQAIHNAKLHEKEQNQRKLSEALAEVTISIASELKLDFVLDRLLDAIATVTPYDSASIFLIEKEKIQVKRHRGYDQYGTATTIENSIWDMADMPLVREMTLKNSPMAVLDVQKEPRWRPSKNAAHVRSWCGTPIFIRGNLLGFISLDKAEAGFYTKERIAPLVSFAASAGIAIQNARLFAHQVSLANIDGLTGLPNRRRFDKRLSEEMQRTLRYKQTTSLIFFDIDHFKRFNDTYGHLVGDDVLKELSIILNQNLRMIDIPARYGGEEFAVILPQTSAIDAYLVAERLRQAVEINRFSKNNNLQVTISLGVASAPEHAETPEQIISAADKALYKAKNTGRNKVVSYDLN